MADNSSGSRVRFSPNQKTEDITVVPGLDGESADVHVGFLRCSHVYHVNVAVPHQLGPNVTCEGHAHAKLLRQEEKDSDQFVFELTAHAEGLMLITVRLVGEQPGRRSFSVRFHAKVLGKLMGTPSLKNGVKYIGIREDDLTEDEMSDSEL